MQSSYLPRSPTCLATEQDKQDAEQIPGAASASHRGGCARLLDPLSAAALAQMHRARQSRAPEPLAACDSPSSSALPQRAATPLPPPARVALPPAAWCPGLSGYADPGVAAPSETWSTHSPSVLEPLPPCTLPPPVVLQPQATRWSRRCCLRFMKPGATRALGTGQPPGRCSLDNKGQPQGSPLPSAPTRSGARGYTPPAVEVIRVRTAGRKD